MNISCLSCWISSEKHWNHIWILIGWYNNCKESKKKNFMKKIFFRSNFDCDRIQYLYIDYFIA